MILLSYRAENSMKFPKAEAREPTPDSHNQMSLTFDYFLYTIILNSR